MNHHEITAIFKIQLKLLHKNLRLFIVISNSFKNML